MSTLQLTTFVSGFQFLDSLRWHQGHIWTSDFFRSEVIRIGLDGRSEVMAKIPGDPSGIGFLPDGTPLVVSQHEQKVYAIKAGGTLALHADLHGLVRGNANDMVVLPNGNAYVGNFGFDVHAGEVPKPTNLVLVRPNGKAEVAASGMMFPNGAALVPGTNTLVVAETFAARIAAFDVAEDGSLENRRVWAQLPAGSLPDGLCCDANGTVWVASVWGDQGERFIHVAEGGEILDVIHTPGRWAIACTFGGPELQTLYCATAETTLEDHRRRISRASIEQVTPPVPGYRG